MSESRYPDSVCSFLSAHGGEHLCSGALAEMPEVVRVFRAAAPCGEADPLGPAHLAWLSAMADCISAMDERVYEHVRALMDLFRASVFAAPQDRLSAEDAWRPLLDRGIQLGLLPEDLYGIFPARPHVAVPDLLCGGKGGCLS